MEIVYIKGQINNTITEHLLPLSFTFLLIIFKMFNSQNSAQLSTDDNLVKCECTVCKACPVLKCAYVTKRAYSYHQTNDAIKRSRSNGNLN